MRISGGVARGIQLAVPKGDRTRPATDGMRQAVFSSLGARVSGARFLDLFAGSGAYGLEALSRGASGGVFVENNARALACLRENVAAVCKSLGCPTSVVSLQQSDALLVSPCADRAPDLIFVDPPYETIDQVGPVLFTRLLDVVRGNAEALVLFELPGELELDPPGWTTVKRLGKGRGQPTVAILRQTAGR